MLLQSLNEEGHTIIVVTHNSDMGAYATRSIKVQDGECFA
jgi:putative ABC transport system ATP-binding protein